jgi:hypothetical protein
MHIVFQQDKDGYKKDQICYVERSLARRFCENGIAIPHQKHLDNIYDAEQVIIKAKKKAKAEKSKADEKKKAELLAKKNTKAEKSDSKKPGKSEKSVKK